MNSFHLKTFPNQDYLLNPSRAERHYIFDRDGKKYIDLTAGGTSFNLLGSGNKKIHQGIINQMQKFEHLDCKSFDDENREILADILINTSDAFKDNPKKVFNFIKNQVAIIKNGLFLEISHTMELLVVLCQ